MAGLPLAPMPRRNQGPQLLYRLKALATKPRYAILLLVVFVLFVMNVFPGVGYISTPRISSSGLGREVTSLQKKAYTLVDRRRPTCRQTSWHQKRYAPLHSTTASRTINIFLAINFYNNEEVLPTFFQELPLLLHHLGPHQVFVSVYENGSDDKTPELLKLLGDLLTALGTPHQIVARGKEEKSNKENGRRIYVLAAARNAALEPLYSGEAAKTVPGGLFHEMLFMNDIHFCAVDMMEVLYQKRLQGANQACAMDWGGKVVYDRWIIRTMTGRTFYRYDELVEYFNGPPAPEGQTKPVPQLLPYDEVDRVRMDELLPLQVFSCWNGATVIDANAFLQPHNIRFRTAKHDLDEHGKSKEVTEKASECFLASVDLWKAKMGKILVVPKASVAYGFDDYNYYRKDGPSPKKRVPTLEKVTWKTNPPKEIAFQDNAAWYIPERWGPWDEP